MTQVYNVRGDGKAKHVKAYQLKPLNLEQKWNILTMEDGWTDLCFNNIHPTDRSVLDDLNNICTKLGFTLVNESPAPIAKGEYRGDLEKTIAVTMKVEKGDVYDINVMGVENVKEILYANLDNVAIEVTIRSMLQDEIQETRLILEPVGRGSPLPSGYGVRKNMMVKWRTSGITEDLEHRGFGGPKERARNAAVAFTRLLNNIA